MDKVISARFADRAEQKLLNFYSEMKDVRESSRTQVRKIPFTSATRAWMAAKKARRAGAWGPLGFVCAIFPSL
eukprot:s2111_g3.t2